MLYSKSLWMQTKNKIILKYWCSWKYYIWLSVFCLLKRLVHTRSSRLLFYLPLNWWQNPFWLQKEQDQTYSQGLAALGQILQFLHSLLSGKIHIAFRVWSTNASSFLKIAVYQIACNMNVHEILHDKCWCKEQCLAVLSQISKTWKGNTVTIISSEILR